MRQRFKVSPYITFIFISYYIQLLIFTLFRVALYLANAGALKEEFRSMVNTAFVFGYKFDSLVICYILALPFLVLSVAHLLRKHTKWVWKTVSVFISISGVISILAASADIPYYSFFNTRLTASVHMWIENPSTMFSFIFTEPYYYPFILTFLLLSIFYMYLTMRLGKKYYEQSQHYDNKISYDLSLFALTAVCIFFGMRGGNIKRTVKLKETFFSNNAFINQLGVNPIYSYAYSLTRNHLNFIDEDAAIANVKDYLNIGNTSKTHPMARMVNNGSENGQMNVVLVIMESMSANMTSMFGNEHMPTPVLDSLSKRGISFSNFYTAGIHTCNGIYSTLYGMPALMNEHPMLNTHANGLKLTGLPVTLKDKGYQTALFCSHDDAFDNIGTFLPRNGIDSVYCSRHYPEAEKVNIWGVSDEYLFKYALGKLDEMANTGKPFFSGILTISTHEPPQLPSNTTFKSKFDEPLYQVYEYADHCIGQFMQQCATREWFKNTVFVFVADHGLSIDKTYEMSLSFNHTPCIIYSPALIKEAQVVKNPALQIDIFPTLMGLMKQSYTNNTMGVDVLTENRPYAYFSADDKLGCIDGKHFYMMNGTENEYLFDYTSNSTENLILKHSAKADSMKRYTHSMLQATQWMIRNNKAGLSQ